MAEPTEEFERPEPAPYDELSEDDVMALQAENERLREALRMALADLDEEHQPTWSSDEAAAKGKAPIGCTLCWPHDGHWPCSSRLIADDLRAALFGSSPAEPECSLCVQYAKTGGPSHEASPRCESGRRPHCSCEVCF